MERFMYYLIDLYEKGYNGDDISAALFLGILMIIGLGITAILAGASDLLEKFMPKGEETPKK